MTKLWYCIVELYANIFLPKTQVTVKCTMAKPHRVLSIEIIAAV